jgi:hypothetical protein
MCRGLARRLRENEDEAEAVARKLNLPPDPATVTGDELDAGSLTYSGDGFKLSLLRADLKKNRNRLATPRPIAGFDLAQPAARRIAPKLVPQILDAVSEELIRDLPNHLMKPRQPVFNALGVGRSGCQTYGDLRRAIRAAAAEVGKDGDLLLHEFADARTWRNSVGPQNIAWMEKYEAELVAKMKAARQPAQKAYARAAAENQRDISEALSVLACHHSPADSVTPDVMKRVEEALLVLASHLSPGSAIAL